MKSKKNVSITKVVMLLIVILIPLLASALIGVYGYNRYKDDYYDEYIENVKEVTLDKAHAYLKYTTVRYEKEPMFKRDVVRGDKNVLRVEVYRVIAMAEVKDDDDKVVVKEQLQYHIAVYNINYSQLIAIKDPTGEEQLLISNIPAIHVKVTDKQDSSQVESYTMGVPTDKDGNSLFIYDYDATPKKDSKGKEITSKFLRWLVFVPGEDFSNSLEFELVISDKPKDEANATYYGVITKFELDNMEDDQSKIDVSKFEVGYNNSQKSAGYLGFIVKDKLWWQMLIALVAVGFIMASFYVIWMAEVQSKTNELTKKKK